MSREDILFELYPEKIVLPKQVYDELCHPSIPHFKRKMDQFAQKDKFSIKEILLDTEEYHLYYELAFSSSKGEVIIGKGEAEGNNIWHNMLGKRRVLPGLTFTEYLRTVK